MIKCENLLGINTIDTYYEFLFCMALAAECGRRHTVLDMSSMRITDKSMLSDDDIAYMHYLRNEGCIFDGSKHSKETILELPRYYFNTEAIAVLGSKLFEEKEDSYYWSTSYAYKHYKGFVDDVLNKKKLGTTILHLTAYMLISIVLGEKPKKPIIFYFKDYEVKTAHIYITLIACINKLSVLKDLVKVEFDKNYIDIMDDLDFKILYDTALHAKRLRKWSCKEKFDAFNLMGFERGSIAVIYERTRISESNPIGVVDRAFIVRIDDYSDDVNSGKAGWKVTKFAVNKTKEELEDDYFGIDEDYRNLFKDLLDPKLGITKSFISFDTLGIGTHFLDEELILMPIEKDEEVSKKVSVNGKQVIMPMNDVDIIYWILNQYNVNFDKDLYKRYYNDGKPLMWDTCDSTQIHSFD